MSVLPRSLCPELRVALLLAVILFPASVALRPFSEMGSARQMLGWENYHVARALVDGRGFSDPFLEPTGPTAWVSPLYTILMAGLLLVLKEKNLVATTVINLTTLVLIASGTSVYAMARRSLSRVPPVVSVVAFLFWIIPFYHWFYVSTTDVWLVMLVVTCMTVTLFRYMTRRKMLPWIWGLLGGIASLTSPALMFAWACVLAQFCLRSKGRRRQWIIAGALMASIAAPWAIRNVLVFGQFIPVKSNAGYEAYLANVVDEDGVYNSNTFSVHPSQFENERFKYTKLGETAYVAHYDGEFRSFLRKHPEKYWHKVGNRALAATLEWVPMVTSQGTTRERIEDAAKRIVYPLPFALLLVGLCLRGPHKSHLSVLGVLYFSYLVGYVAVAFYVRFLLPLTPMLVLSFFFGLDQIMQRIRPAPLATTA